MRRDPARRWARGAGPATLLTVIVGLSTACSGSSDRARDCEGPAGADVLMDVAPGLYQVEVVQGDARATVWWPTRVESTMAAQEREQLVMVGPDRWLRVSTAAGKINVSECWNGGTPDGQCAEIGPPRGGTLTLSRDGAEVARLALFAPVDETIAMAGCPTRRHGTIR